ncbi:MAG: 23S rRNA (guanosine(2251)-2'-O)-methyltransferase RlmB [Desulfobacterales bacterium]|nr:23S rRNA (guanosine(2251)-2'-O)-methyltransferase RlmB [Desulfobacterales bacterium]MBF0396150.1 23S rRNA (guanosine(2251)-2'-O)-methyltransferase RlmB [Desulfobacterales bacterium]
MNTEIIYGIHPVFEALKAKRRNIYEIYIAEKDNIIQRFENIVVKATEQSVPIKSIPINILKNLAKTDEHQGIAAKVDVYPIFDFYDILDGLNNVAPIFLILDSIVDPNNLGALVRTAVCLGIESVIIPKDRSVSPTPAVSKASAGAIEHMKISKVTNITNSIKKLKSMDFWVVGMDKLGDKSIYDVDLTGPIAIIIGSEGKGIRPLIKKECDYLAYIPQLGEIESLNASVAGGIAMYEAFRQRKVKGGIV